MDLCDLDIDFEDWVCIWWLVIEEIVSVVFDCVLWYCVVVVLLSNGMDIYEMGFVLVVLIMGFVLMII